MNNLKPAFVLFFLLFLAIGQSNGQSEPIDLGSEKSQVTRLTDVSEIPEASMLALQESPYSKMNTTIKEDVDCRYANCRVKIAKLKAIYQPWVNSNCRTKNFRVTCCNYEGETVVLVVVIKPTNPKCKYPKDFENFPDGK